VRINIAALEIRTLHVVAVYYLLEMTCTMNKETGLSLACAMSHHDICKINIEMLENVDVIVIVTRLCISFNCKG